MKTIKLLRLSDEAHTAIIAFAKAHGISKYTAIRKCIYNSGLLPQPFDFYEKQEAVLQAAIDRGDKDGTED